MRQTLFSIKNDVPGSDIPLFGFGWLFFLWLAVFAVYVIATTLRRGWNSDNRGGLVMLLMVGAGIVLVIPQILEDGALAIRGYGVMVMVGVVSGVALAAWRANRVGVDPEIIYALAFWMFVAGIGGARLFYIVQKRDQFHSLFQILNFTQGGLVVYGSVIGGLAAAGLFAYAKKQPLLALADLIAPSMLLGLAVGRLGCLLNGCCYGGLCDSHWPLGLSFPENSPPYVSQHQLGQLHGIRLGQDERGRPLVAEVTPGSPAAASGLKSGAIVRAVQLSPARALEAAQFGGSLIGRQVEIDVVRGNTQGAFTVPIGWTPGNELGLAYKADTITATSAAGPAAKGGLRVGDRVNRVTLPEAASLADAASVLGYAGRRVTIETRDGSTFNWTLPVVPPRSLKVHPTQIYSSIGAAALCFFLWVYYPFRRRDGEVFLWMITLYPIGRFLIEVIRDDEAGQFGTPLTISQLLSIVLLIAAIGLWVWLIVTKRSVRLNPHERVTD